MAEIERIRNYGTVYQPGTAARALPVPKPDREDERKKKKEQAERARQQIEARVAEKCRAANEYTKVQMLVILTCAALFVAASSFFIVNLSRQETMKKDIERLELQIQTIHQDNRIMQNLKNSSIDFQDVYAYATEVLGMRTPMKQQMIYYDQPTVEFVHKYGEIPK